MLLSRNHENVLGAKAAAARGNPVRDVLDAIVERLKVRMPSTIRRIETFAYDKKEFDLAEDNAAIAVAYQSSAYSRDGMAGALSAARSMTIMVVYLHRVLDGQEDAIIQKRIEDIRLALHGSSFAGSKPLVPVEDAIDDYDEGVCLSHITFEAAIPALPSPPRRSE